MKVALNILLIAAVLLLVYMCYRSIQTPLEFTAEKDKREKAIIARLVDIRKAQIEYKNVNKVHAGTFDDLIKFLDEKELPFLIKEGVLTDEQLEKGMTEREAVKKGLIKRDTFWMLAKDTLFGKGYAAGEIRYVPGTQVQFNMDTATLISGSGYSINVFEASVKFDDYLSDLNMQELINLDDKANKQNKFPGLRVGSLTEINNNAGNWE
jgi:phosphoribosyl-AMP cyclohydrolase